MNEKFDYLQSEVELLYKYIKRDVYNIQVAIEMANSILDILIRYKTANKLLGNDFPDIVKEKDNGKN